MRICQVLAGNEDGGLEKHTIELSMQLKNRGYDVSVIAHEDYKPHFKGVDFIPLDLSKGRKNIFILLKLYKILKNANFDIVHAQANKATYMIGLIKPFINAKVIATLHNIKSNLKPFTKADKVITVSDRIGEKLDINYKTTVYNGIDIDKINSASLIDLKKEFNIKNDFPIFVSVGRLVKAKGFDLLIEALKDVDINLIIVGDGEDKKTLELQIKNIGKEKDIILAGFRDDVLNIMKSSDVVIISSRNEGFSYVFVEALCLDKPLLSTDVADIKKFIPKDTQIEEKTPLSIKKTVGYFIENKDTINFMPYYKKAKELTVENMVDNTIAIYKEALK